MALKMYLALLAKNLNEPIVNCCLCALPSFGKDKLSQCTLCYRWFHPNHYPPCSALNKPWHCSLCLNDIFPFNHITDDHEFKRSILFLPRDKHLIDSLMNGSKFELYSNPDTNRLLLNNRDLDSDYNFFDVRPWESVYKTYETHN